MSYHVEAPRFGFEELPDRILVREDGAYGDHKAHGTPIIDYWYVLEQRIPPTEREIISAHLEQLEVDNAKLRKLLLDVWNDAMLFDGFWNYVNDDGEIYNEDELPHYYDRMRELGVEVDK